MLSGTSGCLGMGGQFGCLGVDGKAGVTSTLHSHWTIFPLARDRRPSTFDVHAHDRNIWSSLVGESKSDVRGVMEARSEKHANGRHHKYDHTPQCARHYPDLGSEP